MTIVQSSRTFLRSTLAVRNNLRNIPVKSDLENIDIQQNLVGVYLEICKSHNSQFEMRDENGR